MKYIKYYKKVAKLLLFLILFAQNTNAQGQGTLTGPTQVCNGSQNVTYYFNPSGVPNTTFEWGYFPGVTVNGASTNSMITLNFNTSWPTGQISVTEKSGSLVVSYGILQINVKHTPDLGPITGTAMVGCPSSTNYQNYSVPLNSTVKDYIWTVPNGATFTGVLNQPNKIIVNYGSGSVSGIVSVKAGCGANVGNASTLAITVNPFPSAAQAFSGQLSICKGLTGPTNAVYNVPIIANATSYQWTLPTGAICTSGCTTNIINVSYGATAVSGNITVKGINNCGAGTSYSLPVTVNNTTPTTTGAISGSATVCWGQNIVYSVPAIANASSYQWTLPNGAVGASTTNSINVYYPYYSDSGNITVHPVNGCGVGTTSSIPITVNAFTPFYNGVISGAAVVCLGQNNVIYSIPPINYADSYQWTLPTGAIGTSTTNTILVNYGNSAVSGNIKVRGINGCGLGNMLSLNISVGIPSNPDTIIGSNSICKGSTQTYTVPSIANAISYVWTLPNGATGNSTSNSIAVNYGTSAISGNITVKGMNDCGDGVTSALPINVITTLSPTGNITQSFLPGQTLSNLQVTGTNLTWYANQTDAVNHANPILNSTLLVNGATYYVTQTNNGCESSSLAITATVALGLTDFLKDRFTYYPNPVNTILNFENNNTISIITLFNFLGQVIQENEINSLTGQLDMSKLPIGNYLLRFKTDNGDTTIKLIKY